MMYLQKKHILILSLLSFAHLQSIAARESFEKSAEAKQFKKAVNDIRWQSRYRSRFWSCDRKNKLQQKIEEELIQKIEAVKDVRLLNLSLDKEGNTLLHLAAKKGYLALMKKLIEKGANLSMVNCSGRTALFLVLHADCRPRWEEADSSEKDTIGQQYMGIITQLIKQMSQQALGVLDKQTGRTILHDELLYILSIIMHQKEADVVCIQQYLQIVEELIEKMSEQALGAVDKTTGRTALHSALMGAGFAIKRGSDALSLQYLQIVEKLIEKMGEQALGAVDKKTGQTALHGALMGAVLAIGVDADVRIQQYLLQIVEKLIGKMNQQALSAVDKTTGQTALMWAMNTYCKLILFAVNNANLKEKYLKVIETLIDRMDLKSLEAMMTGQEGCSVFHRTLLHYRVPEVKQSLLHIMKVLAQRGVDVNQKDLEGGLPWA